VTSDREWREALAAGGALLDTGEHWAAHEAWEGLWRAEADARRALIIQGLIQIAAALHKVHEQRDLAAARRILGRAMDKLRAQADLLDALGLSRFVAEAGAYQAALVGASELADAGRVAPPRFGSAARASQRG
jgi:predicted metal-dependent hydrolase